MFIETDAYDVYYFWVSALPFFVSVLLYLYIRFKLSDTIKGLVLFFLCVALFFVSAFLFARGEDLYPAVKVWIVEKNEEGFLKTEKAVLFTTPFKFADNSSSIIKPDEREPGEWYLLINNTGSTLFVETVSYGESNAIFIPDESQGTRAVPQYSAGYFKGLDFFCQERESLPDILEVYIRNSGSGSHYSSLRYWVRW